MMSQIMRTTQPQLFKWEVTKETAKMVISSFYALEVHKRQKSLVKSNDLAVVIDKIAEHMTNPKKAGLFFVGGVGCGKSTMMYALREAHNYLYPSHKDIGIVIKDATDIVMQVQKQSATLDYKGMEDMLAIDDLGKEPTQVMVFGSTIQPIVEIFESRYSRMLPMLITTNLETKQIAEKYGKRIADRCNEMFQVIVFPQDSYRRL